MGDRTPASQPSPPPPAADEPNPRAASSQVDEMGEESFPASDPPALWIWEPAPKGQPPATARE